MCQYCMLQILKFFSNIIITSFSKSLYQVMFLLIFTLCFPHLYKEKGYQYLKKFFCPLRIEINYMYRFTLNKLIINLCPRLEFSMVYVNSIAVLKSRKFYCNVTKYVLTSLDELSREYVLKELTDIFYLRCTPLVC